MCWAIQTPHGSSACSGRSQRVCRTSPTQFKTSPPGLTATALLVAGGKAALDALQAMSIATGLVYTILMCIACQVCPVLLTHADTSCTRPCGRPCRWRRGSWTPGDLPSLSTSSTLSSPSPTATSSGSDLGPSSCHCSSCSTTLQDRANSRVSHPLQGICSGMSTMST